MIPVYPAIQKVATLTGGTTSPWKILALTEKGPKPYVVKIFTTKHIEQTSAVAHELFGNILAGMLDLNCPGAALIQFGVDYMETLSQTDREDLASKDGRICFGSEFIEGAILFHKNMPRSILDRYDIDKIYSFDNVIFNPDRNNNKPNILLKNREYFLIDHELALTINEQTIKSLFTEKWFYQYHKHIFYRYLKLASVDDKRFFFGAFEETIRYVSFQKLDAYKEILETYGHPIGEYNVLLSYLRTIQDNSSNFVKMLKKQVS